MGTLHRSARFALVLPVIVVLAACATTNPQTTTVGGAAGGTAVIAQGAGVPSDDPGTTAGDVPAPGSTASAGAVDTAGGVVQTGGSAAPGSAAPVPGVTSAPVAGQSAAPASTTIRQPTGTTPRASTSARSGAPGSSATSATQAPAAGSSSGAATTVAPVKIGFVYVDETSNAAVNSAAGFATSNTLSEKQAVEELRDYYNAHGGLDGRQIQLVEDPTSDTSTDYDGDATAACQMFTQDDPVPIVIDFSFGSEGGFAGCLNKAGVEDLVGGPPTDAASLAGLPYVLSPQYMTPDRNYSAPLTELTASGYLTSKSKLGIFIDSCPSTQAAYTNTIAPLIKRLGLTVAAKQSTTCINGEGGLGQASTDAASAVLNFQMNSVDRVMVISNFDQTYWLLFAEAANTQNYTPGYVMASTGEPTVLEAGNLPAGQKPSMHGAGYIPATDADNQTFPGTAAEGACDKMVEAQGLTPSGYEDYFLISVSCAPFQVLAAAFQADGADARAPVLSKAIAGLGRSLQDPGVLGGLADFSTQDSPVEAQVFGWNTTCSCLQYSGSPDPV